MPLPPSPDDLEELLAAVRSGDASDAIRGYDWQRWLTVERWLELRPDQALWIEWTEDFTIASADGHCVAIQARDRKRPCSLADQSVLAVLGRAIERASAAETVIWTSSGIALERSAPFGKETAGIDYWRQVANNKAPPEPLRLFLLKQNKLPHSARDIVNLTNLNDFVELTRRIHWNTSSPALPNLRDQVAKKTRSRLAHLNVAMPELMAGSATALLFEHVAAVAVRPSPRDRRLTAGELDDVLLTHNAAMSARGRAETIRASVPPVRLPKTGRGAPTPFSAAWFAYTERAIPMIGREEASRRLFDFLEDERPALWWTLQGAGGVGKSRLAQEFCLGLDGDWVAGFALHDQIKDLVGHIATSHKNHFVVIDYASAHAATSSEFLYSAVALLASGHKLRILLIDRDMGPQADFWKTFLPEFTSRAAALTEIRFGDPLELPDLKNHEAEVLAAWLNAAGLNIRRLLPKPSSKRWQGIRRLTSSRPLHLGLLAAVLAAGHSEPKTPAELLKAVLAREIRRWRDQTTDPTEFTRVLEVIAVGTACWGLPVPWLGDNNPVKIYSSRENAQLSFMREDEGVWRDATFDELSRYPLPVNVAERVLEQSLEGLLSDFSVCDNIRDLHRTLTLSRNALGNSWSLKPDLIGQMFLARYWAPPRFLDEPGTLTPATDDARQRQLSAAWDISPLTLTFTLEQMRWLPWAKEAVLRSVITLAERLSAPLKVEPEHFRQFTFLLSNTWAHLGGEETSQTDRATVLSALEQFATAHPENPLANYLYWRRLKGSTIYEEPSRYEEAFSHLLALIPSFAGVDASFTPQLHICDVARGYMNIGENWNDIEKVERTHSIVESTFANFDNVEDFHDTVARFYGLISNLERPSLTAARRRYPRLLGAIEMSLRRVIEGGHLSSLGVLYAAEGLANLTVHHRKLRRVDDAKRLAEKVEALSHRVENPTDISMPRLTAIFNLAILDLELRNHPGARVNCRKAANLPLDPDGSTVGGVAEILDYALTECITQGAADEVLYYLDEACALWAARTDPGPWLELDQTIVDIEILIGDKFDDQTISSAAAILDRHIHGEAYRRIKSLLEEKPVVIHSRKKFEREVLAAFRFAKLGGMSMALERKVGRLLGAYVWHFGTSFPKRISTAWPFLVEKDSSGVEVEITDGAFPGTMAMRFDFVSSAPRRFARGITHRLP